MATVTPTEVTTPNINITAFKWLGFAASGDVGTAVAMPDLPDRTVQIIGTFTGSAEITIEGSLDGGTTYTALTDPQGNAIVKTAAAIEAITERVLLIRPRCTAGSGGASANVYILMGGHRNG